MVQEMPCGRLPHLEWQAGRPPPPPGCMSAACLVCVVTSACVRSGCGGDTERVCPRGLTSHCTGHRSAGPSSSHSPTPWPSLAHTGPSMPWDRERRSCPGLNVRCVAVAAVQRRRAGWGAHNGSEARSHTRWSQPQGRDTCTSYTGPTKGLVFP